VEGEDYKESKKQDKVDEGASKEKDESTPNLSEDKANINFGGLIALSKLQK